MSNGARFPTRYRLPARVGAVFGAYLLYRWVGSEHLVPALLVGTGSLLVAWAAIDELMLPPRDTLGLMQVGTIALGLGLAGLGIFLAVM